MLNHFPTRELQIMVGPERHKRHYFTERKKLNLKIALRLWEEIKSLSNTATKMYIVDLLMHVRTGCPVMARFSFFHLHPCKGPERALLAPSSRKWHVNTTILAILPIRKCKSTHWYECTAIFTDYWYIYIPADHMAAINLSMQTGSRWPAEIQSDHQNGERVI